jgi:hypothetical protein
LQGLIVVVGMFALRVVGLIAALAAGFGLLATFGALAAYDHNSDRDTLAGAAAIRRLYGGLYRRGNRRMVRADVAVSRKHTARVKARQSSGLVNFSPLLLAQSAWPQTDRAL